MEGEKVHQAIEPLAFLLGTWRGQGKGEYPNVDDFVYREESTFWHVGKPWLGYMQRTWSLDSDLPMHTEMGYWRPQPDGGLEIVLAHSLGVTEVQEGTFRGGHIEVISTQLGATTTAKAVRSLARTFDVERDLMTYEVKMAYGEVPLQHHLGAELRRVEG
ncbi:MAG: FABP family protein [Actinomycetota bacterium]|nr:FABP family protein [Actinomycetota bacterium]